MIYGIFYQSSGLGNQLARYIATRVLALDKGYDWSMFYVPNDYSKDKYFKGSGFMKLLEERIQLAPAFGENIYNRFEEKKVRENGVDISSYDPEFNFIKDNTVIDGEFQDEKYWAHREKEVDEWLKVELLDVPDDLCVIGFRGGEFAVYPDLFLTPEYWQEGIKMMREINPNMRFQVHTDDKPLAQQFFPDFEAIHDIGINWRSMRYAKYAIIANSSFFILPRWLSKGLTIAPRFWGRRNVGVWSMNQNYYKRFLHI